MKIKPGDKLLCYLKGASCWIDVLWLSKKTIVRAFEVEHTTAVYSGILRKAALLALQPNFHTRLHITAPEERRKKVFQERQRPAFSMTTA